MAFAGAIGFWLGVDAEKKPLEDISEYNEHSGSRQVPGVLAE
jgi:hypothetical protein